MMLISRNTLTLPETQDGGKSTVCRACGSIFRFDSKTLQPKYCTTCRQERRRALDRKLAEKKRRKRGVPALKGTEVPCAKCGRQFIRSNIKHVYCNVCGEENYRRRTRQTSRDKHATKEGREAANKWLRNRYRSDPAWRVSSHMRKLIHKALRSKKQGRSWRELLTYSLSDLMAHLESQFRPGMTWNNYGRWHIDHKIPRKYFKFQSEDDPAFKAAWALSNLQPLWALDNIRKGAKLGVVLVDEGCSMKTFQITGYPRGFTPSTTMIVAARNDVEARAKGIAVLRGRGCDVPPEVLSVVEDKPRPVETWP